MIFQLTSFAHDRARAAAPDISFRDIEDFNTEFADDFYPDWSRYSSYIFRLVITIPLTYINRRYKTYKYPLHERAPKATRCFENRNYLHIHPPG